MDFLQGIVSFFYNYDTIEKLMYEIFFGYPFPINIVLLIGCIYYSLRKKLNKTIMIFIVSALLFEIIRTCYIFGISSLGVRTYDIFKIFTNEKDRDIVYGIELIIGMNSAIAEVVIIIICLIYIFSMKILRKSKIIISSILLVVLSISISHWVFIIRCDDWQIRGLMRYQKNLEDRYWGLRKEMRQKQLKKGK